MRIDKFLKVARIIKRRTVAKEACDQGRVAVNGRPAKSGTNLEVGDTVKIEFG
ncbi:S4 domain-containing protein, partial [Streptococcus anginosus]